MHSNSTLGDEGQLVDSKTLHRDCDAVSIVSWVLSLNVVKTLLSQEWQATLMTAKHLLVQLVLPIYLGKPCLVLVLLLIGEYYVAA